MLSKRRYDGYLREEQRVALVEHARVLARAEPRKLAVCVCSDDGAKAVHEARAQVTMVPRSMAAQV